MKLIDIAEAKRQIKRISEELTEPLLLIGGLAVNQYVSTRNSQDIDLICNHETIRSLVYQLYPTTTWRITEKNYDEYRPSYHIEHKHKKEYPIVKIGPKIKEREAYKYLEWDILERGSIPFKYKNEDIENILVPPMEALCYSKIVSFLGRLEKQKEKLSQDLCDILELTNHDSFQLGILLNLIISNNFEAEMENNFHSRLDLIGQSIDDSNLGKIIRLFSKQNTTNLKVAKNTNANMLQPRPSIIKSQNKIRLAAFDLDGTLIKGIRHSWTMVWNQLKITNDEQKQRKVQFRRGELSYLDWCKLDSDSFIKHGLTKNHFEEIAKINHLSLTKNLKQGLMELKNNGIMTAIISGGIDALLYALLPDADDYFDEILINRFVFSDDGRFEKISATEYDWNDSKVGVVGKRRGLERICEKYNISIMDTAFIGDDLNDIEAMKVAGLKIFYSGETREFAPDEHLPAEIVIIPENNLLKVAERILKPPVGEQVD